MNCGAVTLLSEAQYSTDARVRASRLGSDGMGVPIRPEPHFPQEINGPAVGDDGGPIFFVVSARSASPAGRHRPVTGSGGRAGELD